MASTETPKEKSKNPVIKFNFMYLVIGIWLLILGRDFYLMNRQIESLPYSQFLSYVKSGQVEKAVVGQETITGDLKSAPAGHQKSFTTVKMEDPALAQTLAAGGVKFEAVRDTAFWRDVLSWIVPFFFFALLFRMVASRMKGMGGGGILSAIGKSKARVYVEKDLTTRFKDVAGIQEAKEELQEVVNFLKEPIPYSRLGGRMPKGVLLVGPPGTGKTLLARAVAGEAGVPFFLINGSEFVELFVGLGAARVRDLFAQARAQAPCIVFIDELDALGKARGIGGMGGSSNDEKEQTLNQLLAEMDGFDVSSGIILLAATNRPEVLDPALLRAGRFDRHVVVDKPDRQGRVEILAIHMKKTKIATDINSEAVASLTSGFSGADLANLVNEAALIATRRKAEAVELRDFTEAIERIVAGLERKSRLLGPEERRRVAFHEMGHATVALAVGEHEAVHKVSIIPRGIAALGYTLRRPTEDRYLLSKPELESRMTVAMGGRASEEIFFKMISTGAADDLDKATDIARAMITRYGMSDVLGLAILEKESSPLLGNGMHRSFDYSEKTAERIDEEVKLILRSSLTRALNLIERFRPFIEEGAQLLLIKETIDEKELAHLWQKHQAESIRVA